MKIKTSFHKVSLLGCILLLSAVISSCKKEQPDAAQPKTQEDVAVAFLAKQGFKAENIVFKDGKYIIDTDIVISQEDVAERMKNESASGAPQTEHWRHTYIIKPPYHKNIRLYIEAPVTAEWKTAVQGAIANWNNMPGQGTTIELGMSISTVSTAYDTRVFMGYENASWIARAYLPNSSGKPGVSIEINSKYNTMSASQKLFAITHELGHTIGLNHTNQTSGTFIPTTPVTDANSVMNSFVLPWNGFTAGDAQATKVLYPK